MTAACWESSWTSARWRSWATTRSNPLAIDRGAVRLIATVPESRVAEVDCVLVADQDGHVVGIGTVDVALSGGDVVTGLASAIAPPGSMSYTVVLVTDAGDQVLLDRPVEESEIVVG